MGLIQKIYDWIGSRKTPSWLKDTLQIVQDILVSVAIQVGQSYIEALEKKIVDVSEIKNWSNREKFTDVFNYARKKLNITDLSDRYLNLVIEALYAKLRANKKIN